MSLKPFSHLQQLIFLKDLIVLFLKLSTILKFLEVGFQTQVGFLNISYVRNHEAPICTARMHLWGQSPAASLCANRRRIRQMDVSIQYMYIHIRIQSLFRNVPTSSSPSSHPPIPYFPPTGLIWGWVPHTLALDTMVLKDRGSLVTNGQPQILQLVQMHMSSASAAPWLCSAVALGKGAILLMVFFIRASASGPWNSSTGGSTEARKWLPVLSHTQPGLHLCPSTFQSPNQKGQWPVLEYPFPTSDKPELWESRGHLKVSVKEIFYQTLWVTDINSGGVFCAALGPAPLSVQEEVNSLPAITTQVFPSRPHSQPRKLWLPISGLFSLLPLNMGQLWKQKNRAWSTSDTQLKGSKISFCFTCC